MSKDHIMISGPDPEVYYCTSCLRIELRKFGQDVVVLNMGDAAAHGGDTFASGNPDPRLSPFDDFMNGLRDNGG